MVVYGIQSRLWSLFEKDAVRNGKLLSDDPVRVDCAVQHTHVVLRWSWITSAVAAINAVLG
jgi:hypothetical protein